MQVQYSELTGTQGEGRQRKPVGNWPRRLRGANNHLFKEKAIQTQYPVARTKARVATDIEECRGHHGPYPTIASLLD